MNIKKLSKDISFLEPAFKDNYCAVCFSSSNYYVPYLTTAIHSLIENSNQEWNYDIVIFNKDISETNQTIIKKTYEKENISIRFYSVKTIFEGTNIAVPTHIDTVTIETYYRLLTPYIMKQYNKVLFLDSDIMVLSDVNDLYSKDISQYALAASHEILLEAAHIEAWYKALTNEEENERKIKSVEKGVEACLKHVNSVGVENTKDYFQAGVILFNCNYFNKNNYVETLFENIQRRNYGIVDQDALNELCHKNAFILNGQWNFTPLNQGDYFMHMREENRQIQLAIKEPKILHFVGSGMKPWNLYEGYYHAIWWEYARKTPYYETILTRLQMEKAKKDTSVPTLNIQKYVNLINYKKNVLKYWKYKFFKNFVTGKTKERYGIKKAHYKNLVRDAKATFREYR